jgi:lipopolysaccharide transport system permease protein
LSEVLAYRTFIRNMVVKDLKVRYQASFLGFLWSMLNPLLMLGLYTVVFATIMRVQTENYTFFLFSGLMPWIFFSGSLMGSTSSVIGSAALIRKVYFPRETLTLATVLFNFVQLVLALVVVVPGLVVFTGARLGWTAWLAIPLLLLHFTFTLGIAFALSALTTLYRDVQHFTEIALLFLFWASPILYTVEMAPRGLQVWFRLTPLAGFTIAYQDLLVHHRLPSAEMVMMLVLWTVATLVVGHAVFRRLSPSFAEAV